MSRTVTLGGDRLGSGKDLKVHLKNYERSTHDLGHVIRTTMSAGTLVPFLSEVALPGDTFDIDLNCDVKTTPTIGPLFGSYKLQLDVFLAPVRLYQGQLHNNKLGIGMNMEAVKLPQIKFEANNLEQYYNGKDPNQQQISTSSIFPYLGIRGLGRSKTGNNITTYKNALAYLMYWDIVKNYYANKQEEIGAVIHGENKEITDDFIALLEFYTNDDEETNGIAIKEYTQDSPNIGKNVPIFGIGQYGAIESENITLLRIDNNSAITDLEFLVKGNTWNAADGVWTSYKEIFKRVNKSKRQTGVWELRDPYEGYPIFNFRITSLGMTTEPVVKLFDLANIDQMREDILAAVKDTAPFIIDKNSPEPYNLPLKQIGTGQGIYAKRAQEGLALKTYQSDIFNNWLSTEWIDGDEGINTITAISTEGDSFTIDTLNLSKKVYDMLNRIAVSGGSYNDWIDAVYSHNASRRAESPIYMGGLSKEIVFAEVESSAEVDGIGGVEPLGTLAGRGTLSSKHKGGKVTIRVDEPSYIIGIVSITPRIDYYQGNKWDTNLKSMDDFHKPALDQIGFQDLITEQMAAWDVIDGEVFSAGKQPAWLNYMTSYNKVYGNFADEGKEMFMTLTRNYKPKHNMRAEESIISDLTTYIDPADYNYMFAHTKRDAMNFWVQIGMNMIARRKMSAKVMPNL